MDELRELDVKVAEALGCKVRMTDVASAWSWGQMSQDAVCGCDRDEHGCYPHGTDAEWSAPDRLRHYSTDISAAWELVERMIRAGWDFEIAMDNEEAEAIFVPDRCHGETSLARAPTAPEAICRAFLAAMEVQC